MTLRWTIVLLACLVMSTVASAGETVAAENLAIAMSTLLQGMSLVSTVIRAALVVLRTVFAWVFWVLMVLFGMVWHAVLVKPLSLVLRIVSVLYPVILFCFAAVACGLLIGTCAGFAAEAFSFALLAVTWGEAPKKEIPVIKAASDVTHEDPPALEPMDDDSDEDSHVPLSGTYIKMNDDKNKSPTSSRQDTYDMDLRSNVESWRRTVSPNTSVLRQESTSFGLRRRISQ